LRTALRTVIDQFVYDLRLTALHFVCVMWISQLMTYCRTGWPA